MRYLVAVLAALAIVVTQLLYGGAMRPVFALPGLFLVGLAGGLGILVSLWGITSSLSLRCVGAVLGFAGWLIWRESVSPDNWLTGSYLRLTVGCLVMYLLFAAVVTKPFPRLTFVSILLGFGLLQVGLAAWQFARPDSAPFLPWLSEQLRIWYAPRWNWRGHGTYLNGNHLAWFLNVTGILALSLACWGRWGLKVKILSFYLALASFGGVFVTLSRGGILAFLVNMAAFLLLSALFLTFGVRGRRSTPLLALAATVILAGGIVLLLFQGSLTVQQRFRDLLTDTYRPAVLEAAGRQAQLDPLVGTGPGTFRYFGRMFREHLVFTDDIFVHNDWAQILGDFGFPALALAVLVLWTHADSGLKALFGMLRERRDVFSRPRSHTAALLIGALCCLGMFATHSVFDFNLQIPANALLAAAFLGMLANPGLIPERTSRTSRILGSVLGVVTLASGGWLVSLVGKASGPEYFWLAAENAHLRGNFESALVLGTTGLAFGPDSRLDRVMGDVYFDAALGVKTEAMRRNFLLKAEKHFRKSFTLAPEDSVAATRLAEACRLLPNARPSLDAAIAAISLNPNYGRPYELYGEALESEGRLTEALTAYRIAIQLPGNGRAREGIDRVSNKLFILNP